MRYVLYVGDAEKALKQVPSSTVDLVCTSPPYFTMRDELKWSSLEEYFDKMTLIFNQVKRILRPGRIVAVNMSDYICNGERIDLNWQWHKLLRNNFKYRDTIIWRKTGQLVTVSAGKMSSNFIKYKLPMYYSPDRVSEFIMIFSKGSVRIPNYNQEVIDNSRIAVNRDWLTNVWSFAPRQDKRHPAVFPEELPKRIVSLYSYWGETVLDPFLGTGTTMRVAKDLGRSCIGCEINDKYIPTIKQYVRWNEVGLEGNHDYKVIDVRD